MLLALTVLVIGGTSLFTGPVQAVVLNFNETDGVRTTVDSLLCPDRIYIFICEISSDELRLSSFRSDGSLVNIFNAFQGTADMGITSVRSEFNFTAINSVNGLAAIAVMYSSINRSSVELECMDVVDENSTSLSTVVKHPLDAPTRITYRATGKLEWETVECAELYQVDILGMESINTSESFHQLQVPQRNISGTVSAFGGDPVQFGFESPDIVPASCTCNTTGIARNTIGSRPIIQFTGDINIKIGYILTFNNFPEGGRAYYETSDNTTVVITVENDVGEIFIYSNVTVFVAYENGTVYYSLELEASSVSGEGIILFMWILIAILLLIILMGLVLGVIPVVVIKYYSMESKTANKVSYPQGSSHDSNKVGSSEL